MCVCYKCSSPITGNYVPKNDRKCCMKCCCRICRFPLETYEAPPNCIKCRCFKVFFYLNNLKSTFNIKIDVNLILMINTKLKSVREY